MGKKITIIGAGSVGSTIAYTVALSGIADEIVMIDINEKKVLGEALDIRQGIPFLSPCSIYAGGYRDAENSDIVVLTSGAGRKPGQSRLDLTRINVDMLKGITQKIVAYAPEAIYIIVSNPVDILTYVFTKTSGIPEHRIIGSGTILDTARLRARLAEYYKVDQQYIRAYVLGEHGDTSFVPWSMVSLGGMGNKQYQRIRANDTIAYPEIDRDEIESYMRGSGGKVISRKGATYYAVSISVTHIMKCILENTDVVLTVSSMMHGEYGVEDVCLSTLSVVGSDGVMGRVPLSLTDCEVEKLKISANSLKAVIADLDI